jgi:hypothetical protein
MPQGSGMLNTAPSPIPGGYGNPAGANIGIPTSAVGAPPPSSPIPTSLNPTTQQQLPTSMFPANTGGAPSVPTGLTNLSSGFSTGDPGRTQNLYNMLGKAYGQGTGQLLGNMITQGLFSPEVAQALMNAMEPTIARGYNDVLGAFGSEGARFSSAAAIGAGDYMSQARLGQTAQLAQLFQTDQAEQLNLLQSVLPSIQKERANSGGGLLSDILGGLEIAGGALAAPFSGGASLGLLTSGISTIAGGNMGGGSGGGATPTSPLNSLFNQPMNSVPSVPSSMTSQLSSPLSTSSLTDLNLSASAGSLVGGAADQFSPLQLQY